MITYEEFPVFVPFEKDHLVGIVCAPRGELEELGVILLTGGNYTRTHRNRMWVRAARELASLGIASVRFDYKGIGDSGGQIVMSMDDPPWLDASAIIDFFERSTGVTKVALAATCFGGRVAAAVSAQRQDVVSMTALPMPILLQSRAASNVPLRRRIRQRMKSSELGSRLLRSPGVKRARTAVASRRDRPELEVNAGLRDDVARAAGKGVDIRFVFGERSKELPDMRRMLDELEDRLSPEARSRISLEVVEGTEIHRFQTFEDQRLVIRAAVDSALRALGRAPMEAGR